MWVSRDLASELRDLARRFPVLVLTGPRQVGKTSLAERCFPEHRYVSLDTATLAEMAETRPAEFLTRFPPPLVIDEVQYAPALFRHIKAWVDAHRARRGLFVLTGSQGLPLMEAVSDSLAGRAAVVPLLGLSANEWAGCPPARGEQPWREFVWRGGYPALWAEPEAAPPRDRWYQGYLATYLERDVRNLQAVGSLRDFERFVRACAARTGQTLNMSELGRDVGVSSSTARNWMSVLQASGQILLLEPYHRSLGKRLVKSPKLYFADTGLAAFLMGYASAEAMWVGPSAGALFENHVVGQWLRWKYWAEPSANLWYWRNQGGSEVDLLIERDGRLHPIECKLSERPGRRALSGIRALRRFYGSDEVGPASVACTCEHPFELTDGVTARPGWRPWPLDSQAVGDAEQER